MREYRNLGAGPHDFELSDLAGRACARGSVALLQGLQGGDAGRLQCVWGGASRKQGASAHVPADGEMDESRQAIYSCPQPTYFRQARSGNASIRI
jgi:hypothetical protein